MATQFWTSVHRQVCILWGEKFWGKFCILVPSVSIFVSACNSVYSLGHYCLKWVTSFSSNMSLDTEMLWKSTHSKIELLWFCLFHSRRCMPWSASFLSRKQYIWVLKVCNHFVIFSCRDGLFKQLVWKLMLCIIKHCIYWVLWNLVIIPIFMSNMSTEGDFWLLGGSRLTG